MVGSDIDGTSRNRAGVRASFNCRRDIGNCRRDNRNHVHGKGRSGYTCRRWRSAMRLDIRWRSAMRLDIVIAGAWTGGAGASEKVFGAA